jgi:hypothetical protein
MSDDKNWLAHEMELVANESKHWPEWRKREAEAKRTNNQSSPAQQSASSTRSENTPQSVRPPRNM